ncbi:hypothetical protein ACE1ET_19485 [Saccharicrinis sp. FJH62]|uniref:hypothetical protein n=1 Tax=Saccharicrinis sp. FJH62 TaxID=3344657 RepID=UPI0035D4746D
MKLRFSITLGLIIFGFQSLFSQSEFSPSLIVNLQNDTIYGVGNVSKNQEYCLFKKFDAKEFTKYFPNEIKAFRVIDGKYFVSREIKESNGKVNWYFLEFLVDGEIDLFSINSSDRYFIKKENEEFLELDDNNKSIQNIDGKDYMVQNKKYLGYLRAYMSEAPELFPEIDKMDRLDQRDLVNLSIDYHNAICNDNECVNYTKNIPKVTYKFELMSGVTYHNNYYTPQVGFLVHIWRPLKNEKLYLKTGIIYSDRPYLKKDYDKEDEYDYSIKIPLSFQYVFGKRDLKPTIALGWPTGIFLISSFQGGFIYSFSEKFELSFNASIDGLIALPMDLHKELYNNSLGHSLNIGLIYNLK